MDGTPVRNAAGYIRRTGREEVDEGFIEYMPLDLPAPKPRSSDEAVAVEHRQRLLHGRIRMKAGSKAREDRKRRKAKSADEAQWLIRVFQGNPEMDSVNSDVVVNSFNSEVVANSLNSEVVVNSFISEVVVNSLNSEVDNPGLCTKCNDDSGEDFWYHLPGGEVRREWMQRVPSPPVNNLHGKTLRSRRNQPEGRRMTKPSQRCMELTCYKFGCNGEHTV